MTCPACDVVKLGVTYGPLPKLWHTCDLNPMFKEKKIMSQTEACGDPKSCDAPERNILKDADQIINSDRPAKYGEVEESYAKVAEVAQAIFTEGEVSTKGFTPEMALKVMIAVKLVRDSYSPGNPDHLRDAAGYIGLLDQLRQRSGK